jgi:predicted NBD/HSP70 family sugar kinase
MTHSSEQTAKVLSIAATPDVIGAAEPWQPATVLAIDVGGSKVKLLATGQSEPRKFTSGRTLTPARMVEKALDLSRDWGFEAVSIGYPGLVGDHGPTSEPMNLKTGWVGFNFAAAFGRPVRMLNDAALQALGSYDGGRMLFLGLGTGLGSAFIAENVILPLELGRLTFQDEVTLGEVIGRCGMQRLGKREWRQIVINAVSALRNAFVADYVVLGGGNAKEFKELPSGVRQGNNLTAFRGGFRLWTVDDVQTLYPNGTHPPLLPADHTWRLI